jgi:hypothetical protein
MLLVVVRNQAQDFRNPAQNWNGWKFASTISNKHSWLRHNSAGYKNVRNIFFRFTSEMSKSLKKRSKNVEKSFRKSFRKNVKKCHVRLIFFAAATRVQYKVGQDDQTFDRLYRRTTFWQNCAGFFIWRFRVIFYMYKSYISTTPYYGWMWSRDLQLQSLRWQAAGHLNFFFNTFKTTTCW